MAKMRQLLPGQLDGAKAVGIIVFVAIDRSGTIITGGNFAVCDNSIERFGDRWLAIPNGFGNLGLRMHCQPHIEGLLAKLRLRVLVDAGEAAWSDVQRKLADHNRKRDQVANPPDRKGPGPGEGNQNAAKIKQSLTPPKRNVKDCFYPTGNSAARALRTLRDHHPEIHARVLAGELTPNAGMVLADRRKPQVRPREGATG